MSRSKTASKQAEILDAAARVFSARPYHLVLIDDVAQAAHVGKGTIYRYFETKEDLHFAAILYGFDALAGALSEASPRDTDPAVRLERIAHEVIAFFRERGNLSKLLMENERRFEARTEELDKRREVLQRLVEECLAEGVASGVFRVPDVAAAATLFRGMIRAAVESRNPSDTPERLAAVILDIFVQGVGRRGLEE
jgi:AcrR family transcriptional regulator